MCGELAKAAFFQFADLCHIEPAQTRHARVVELAQRAQTKHGLGIDEVCVHIVLMSFAYAGGRIDPDVLIYDNIVRFFNLRTTQIFHISMNFQKIRESDEVELPLLLKNRLVSLVLYLKEKIDAGQFDEMSLAQIAKDNRMTIPQLMEFGFTKANLVCHVVVAENEVLIQKIDGA